MTVKHQKNKAQMDELLALAKQVNLPVRDMLHPTSAQFLTPKLHLL